MNSQRFWGFMILLLGGILFADALGLFEIRLASLWPLLIFLVVLRSLIRKLLRGNAGWVGLSLHLFLLAWSGIEVAHTLGLTTLSGSEVWRVGWPILLVGFGLSLMLGGGSIGPIWWGRGPNRIRTMVGDLRYGSRPWVFENLELSPAIGDVEIDLTTATIHPGDHRLVVDGAIGEVTVWLPADVDVEVRAQVAMGELKVLGEHRSGIGGNVINLTDPAPDPGPEPKLVRIDINLRIGDVQVERIKR